MVDVKTIKPGDRIQQNYCDRRMGTVIGVFHPNGCETEGMGVNYQLDGEDHADSWDWPNSLILVESKPEQPKEQPMKISMDKQYRTRDGKDVVLYTADRKHDGGYTVVGGIIENNGEHSLQIWKSNGSINPSGIENKEDLIEYNPAQDLKMDQAIWVKDYNDTEWYPRHFKGVSSNGNVECWTEGRTSHTASKEYYMFTQWAEWAATKPE